MSTPIKLAPTPITRSEFDRLPDDAFVRVNQMVLSRKSASDCFAILPFSAATVWRKVAEGTFPTPCKISVGMTAWVVGDVRHWLRERAAGGYTPACQSAGAKKAARAARHAGMVQS
ncbi:MAG: AlpA family phage regulatory protein [Polaromonas sp.]|nr:AlpA family phage regulatory protein [Polaromonas sp.]